MDLCFQQRGDTNAQCDGYGKAFEFVLCKTESSLGNSELAMVEFHAVWTSTVQDNFIKWCL